MCYNKTYAQNVPTVGQIVVSRMGHDTDRPYIIVAVLGSDFVLCVDGKYRTVDKPKQKRVKHLRLVCDCEQAQKAVQSGKLTDAKVRKILKENSNAEGR